MNVTRKKRNGAGRGAAAPFTGDFALGSFAREDGKAFAAMVIGASVIDLAIAQRAYAASARAGAGMLSGVASVMDLLQEWEGNFEILQAMFAFLSKEGLDSERLRDAVADLDQLAVLPPIQRPSKILNCAANYSGHLKEMRSYTQTGGDVEPAKIFKGDKSAAQPYFFLKAPSSLCGAYDNIVLPSISDQIDWEAELGVAIGRRSKKLKAEHALDCVAGYMTFNDVSCRNQLFREDRPNFRTDWLSSKSHDSFGPLGPFLVPRAFVPDYARLKMELRVNGEIKQSGVPADMIYSTEEQIEYVSRLMTLEPGDVFATGTLAGVGQATGTFLRPGDIVETEVHGLGRQQNRVVAPDDPA
jgi:2-keto-4-pentenoate hydratase/2-oxohepta-3-ene-1,7-dioic acid hydratase in catechol pathway